MFVDVGAPFPAIRPDSGEIDRCRRLGSGIRVIADSSTAASRPAGLRPNESLDTPVALDSPF